MAFVGCDRYAFVFTFITAEGSGNANDYRACCRSEGRNTARSYGESGTSSGVKTLIATSTDLDGKFKLNIPSEVTQIEVTFVGYKNQQVALKGKTDFKIVLTEDTQEMEEVVVTGMFTRKANSYTGSVTTIKGDELKTVGNEMSCPV